MDYHLDNYPLDNYGFWRITDWIVREYLKESISPNVLYEDEDIDKWIHEIEKMINPEFVQENGMGSLLYRDLDENTPGDILFAVHRGLVMKEITIDQVNDFNHVTAFILRGAVASTVESLFYYERDLEDDGRIYGSELLKDLEY